MQIGSLILVPLSLVQKPREAKKHSLLSSNFFLFRYLAFWVGLADNLRKKKKEYPRERKNVWIARPAYPP